MSFALVDEAYKLLRRQFDASQDPRIGSGRDGNASPSALRVPTGGTNSPSIDALFMTIAPISVYTAICLLIFWVLRRKYHRVYAPRSFLSSLPAHERTPALPSTWFTWVKTFYNLADEEILHRSSLDGYLFLRFLKVLCVICLFGCIVIWPLLLPLHYYGGQGGVQLDSLTFGNVKNVKWCYAHAGIACVFFGFVLYMISRECVYFINLRQAFLLTPYYADRLSSRTVLFSCVDSRLLSERKLRRIFGEAVKNIWIPRDTEDLDRLVEEREQTAARLEKAEILLMKRANTAYQKAVKAGHTAIRRVKSSVTEDHKTFDISVTSAGSISHTSPSHDRSSHDSIGRAIDEPDSGWPLSDRIADPTGMSQEKVAPVIASQFDNQSPVSNADFINLDSLPDVNGSVAAQWIPASHRPRHRPLANYGRKVDTIKWTRTRLKELAPKISKLRRRYRKGEGRPIPAVFIEFHSQVDAQSAYQTLAHHQANHMRSEIVGLRPREIVWPSLYMGWRERIIRGFLVKAFVAVMVLFWAIPAALVGFISQLKNLTKQFKFLSFINLLPKLVLGIISGLLPAIALAALMAIVPMVMRAAARQSGVVTKSRIELFVQNSYFVFQIVQVFLITTLASAAAATFVDVLKDPMSAKDLLSANIPKASNFYISYFLLQGLAMSATRIAHLGSIVRHQLMANATGNPRFIAKKYHRLRKIHWGSVYPVFTNMGVIAITYSLIAPIVLGVALLGLYLIYLSYRYNLLYIYSSERDTRGLHYPRALKHTLTGLYMAEVCMLGLFGIKGAFIPVVIMAAQIVFTALVHICLNDALSPLLYALPRTLAAEEELRKAGNHPWNAANLVDKDDEFDMQDGMENQNQDAGFDSDFDPSDPTDTTAHGHQSSRAIEGAPALVDVSRTTLSSMLSKRYQASPLPGILNSIDFWTYWISPDPSQKPNFILKFLHPEIFADYHTLRSAIPEDLANMDVHYEESVLKDAYSPPSVRDKSPRIWIPRDITGISRQEVAHSSKVIEISDDGAWLSEKNLVDVDVDGETERWVLRDWERIRF